MKREKKKAKFAGPNSALIGRFKWSPMSDTAPNGSFPVIAIRGGMPFLFSQGRISPETVRRDRRRVMRHVAKAAEK